MTRFVTCLLCLVLLTSCTLLGFPNDSMETALPFSSSTDSPFALPTKPTATNTPPRTTTSTPDDIIPPVHPAPILTQYILHAQLDYWGHTLVVSQTIAFTNNAPDSLEDLVLDVEANRWTGSFNLTSLTWGDGDPIAEVELAGNRLTVPLPELLQPGQDIVLNLEYDLTLPSIPPPSDTARPMPFGYTERQTNLVDWYPFIPPYLSGEGWLIHKPGFFGEHQVYDVADFDVQILLSQPVNDMVIAASAPADQSGDVYRFHLDSARNFVWSASHIYTLETTTVGNVVVNSYSFPTDTRAGGQALLDTAQALELYSELFSPFPYASLSVVEADFLDGMEFTGLYFLSRGFYNLYDGTPQGYLTAIAAHETAHQWWYSQVGNDQALTPWLDEALCTYSERLFYETVYPDTLPWWWAFRVDYYEPSGFIDGSIYDYASFRTYRDSVYLNGAKFLEQLRVLVGDTAFFTFLHSYAAAQAGQLSSTDDFFRILQEQTTQDLDRLRTLYFSSAQH